jgi:hypothetical protein
MVGMEGQQETKHAGLVECHSPCARKSLYGAPQYFHMLPQYFDNMGVHDNITQQVIQKFHHHLVPSQN